MVRQIVGIGLSLASIACVIALGCVEGAAKLTVEAPQIPERAITLDVHPDAVKVVTSMPSIVIPEKAISLLVQPGAVQLQVDAPVQQDFQFGKWGVVAAAAIFGAILLFAPPITKWFKRK